MEPRRQATIARESRGTPLVRVIAAAMLRSQRLRAGAWRLMPRSRLSRAVLAEIVRSLYRDFNQSGRPPLSTFSSEVVAIQARELVGGSGRFDGHAGLERMVAELREAWDVLRFDPEQVYEVGDRAGLLVVARAHIAGAGSGASADRLVAHLYAMSRGTIIRFEVFWEPEEGFAAARRM